MPHAMLPQNIEKGRFLYRRAAFKMPSVLGAAFTHASLLATSVGRLRIDVTVRLPRVASVCCVFYTGRRVCAAVRSGSALVHSVGG